MRLVTDPKEVQRLAEELQEENWAFRAWIKSNPDLDNEQLMSVVQWLAEDVAACMNDTLLCPIVFNVVEGMKVELERF
jgi:hypothetical protein